MFKFIIFIKKIKIKTHIKIKNAANEEENYEILANFPFSSDTKRMGIIVRNLETNRIIFYVKGADIIMKNKVPEVQRGFILDECDNLAREGLRTLVITQKLLSSEQYQHWNKKYEDANTSLENRFFIVFKLIILSKLLKKIILIIKLRFIIHLFIFSNIL